MQYIVVSVISWGVHNKTCVPDISNHYSHYSSTFNKGLLMFNLPQPFYCCAYIPVSTLSAHLHTLLNMEVSKGVCVCVGMWVYRGEDDSLTQLEYANTMASRIPHIHRTVFAVMRCNNPSYAVSLLNLLTECKWYPSHSEPCDWINAKTRERECVDDMTLFLYVNIFFRAYAKELGVSWF